MIDWELVSLLLAAFIGLLSLISIMAAKRPFPPITDMEKEA